MEFIMNKNKNDTLDPLSVIIKLFIYGYKPVGTKISISRNKIFIQENGFFQSTIRSVFRDSKNDITPFSLKNRTLKFQDFLFIL